MVAAAEVLDVGVGKEAGVIESVVEPSLPKISTDRLYVRPAEAAKMTGLARSTIFAALYAGQLRGFRRGRAWLIPIDEVRRWVEGDQAA